MWKLNFSTAQNRGHYFSNTCRQNLKIFPQHIQQYEENTLKSDRFNTRSTVQKIRDTGIKTKLIHVADIFMFEIAGVSKDCHWWH